jgi:hypothetical protein
MQDYRGNKTMSRWKQSLIWVVVLTTATVVYRIWSEREGPRFNENLARTEADTKAKLPIRIDDHTTLVDIKYEPTKTAYWYIVDQMLDPRTEQDIQKQLCANSNALRTIREKGFSYEYHYMNKARVSLAAFTITKCP